MKQLQLNVGLLYKGSSKKKHLWWRCEGSHHCYSMHSDADKARVHVYVLEVIQCLIGVGGKLGLVFVFDGLGCDLACFCFWQCLGELLCLIWLDGFFFWTLEFFWYSGWCLLVTLNGVHRSIVDFSINDWIRRCVQVRAKMNVWENKLMPTMRQSDMLVIVIPSHALSLSVVRRVLMSDFMKSMLNIDIFSRKMRKEAKMVITSFGTLLFWLWWAQTCATCAKWTSALPANCAGCVDWVGFSMEGEFVFLGTEDILDALEFAMDTFAVATQYLGGQSKARCPSLPHLWHVVVFTHLGLKGGFPSFLSGHVMWSWWPFL